MVTRYTPGAPGPIRSEIYRELLRVSGAINDNVRALEGLADFSLSSFSVGCYGSVRMSAPQTGPNIGGGWQPLDRMDQVAVTSRLCETTPPGTFSVDYPGVYNLQTEVGFEHNSSNGGRFTILRLFNVTAGAATSLQTSIGIGRNVEVTQWTGNLLFEADAYVASQTLRWEIGGGDSLTSINWLTQSLSVTQVSEWRGPALW